MQQFAAIFVPDFVVQAAMRCQSGGPQNRNQPVAILDGPDSLWRVFACNPAAQLAGVEIGMTQVQAEQSPGLVLQRRAIAQENAAQSALIECALAFSPLVEVRFCSKSPARIACLARHRNSQGKFCKAPLDWASK
jgi:nucleotidyltransferase/DNA polymerase involved in DNA repair